MNVLSIVSDVIKIIKSSIKMQKSQYMKLTESRFLSSYQKLNKYHNPRRAGRTKAACIFINDLNNLGNTVNHVVEMEKSAPEDLCINFAL